MEEVEAVVDSDFAFVVVHVVVVVVHVVAVVVVGTDDGHSSKSVRKWPIREVSNRERYPKVEGCRKRTMKQIAFLVREEKTKRSVSLLHFLRRIALRSWQVLE